MKQHNSHNASRPTPATTGPGRRISLDDCIAIATAAVFAVAAMVLLAGMHGLYLEKIESLSRFSFTADYFSECMSVAGGIVIWLSTALTCTLGHALAGAAVYTLVLLALWATAVAAFSLPRRWWPAAVAVPAASVVFLLGLGYAIYTMKSPGFAFALPVGAIIACWLFRLYRAVRFSGRWLCMGARVLAVAAICCTYPLFGTFSLVAAALCCVYEAAATLRSRNICGLPAIAAGVACILLVPDVWFEHWGGDLAQANIFNTPLPVFIDGEESLSLPVKATFAMLALLAAVAAFTAGGKGHQRHKAMQTWTARGIFATCIAYMCISPYSDANFSLTLRLDKALAEGRWDDAVSYYKALQEEPTRLNCAMAYAAMIHSGRAPYEIFTLKAGSAPYNTVRAERVMHEIGAPVISYYLGMPHFAYRWNMEDMVEYGRNPANLRRLAQCSLLSGDLALARKYLQALSEIPGHGAEAATLLEMAEGRVPVDSDPTMQRLLAMKDTRRTFNADNGYFEGYLWPFLSAAGPGGTAEKQQLTLVSALVYQDQDTFINTLRAVYPAGARLPRHYAEAVLLHDAMKGGNLAGEYDIDAATRQRFENFLNAYSSVKGRGSEQASGVLREAFGDTYWYYYTCVENLDII